VEGKVADEDITGTRQYHRKPVGWSNVGYQTSKNFIGVYSMIWEAEPGASKRLRARKYNAIFVVVQFAVGAPSPTKCWPVDSGVALSGETKPVDGWVLENSSVHEARGSNDRGDRSRQGAGVFLKQPNAPTR
jgi:hypothetical protein